MPHYVQVLESQSSKKGTAETKVLSKSSFYLFIFLNLILLIIFTRVSLPKWAWRELAVAAKSLLQPVIYFSNIQDKLLISQHWWNKKRLAGLTGEKSICVIIIFIFLLSYWNYIVDWIRKFVWFLVLSIEWKG